MVYAVFIKSAHENFTVTVYSEKHFSFFALVVQVTRVEETPRHLRGGDRGARREEGG